MAGCLEDRGVYLGFRRLAILDLSSDANQPMSSPDGNSAIVFNGEIYNYIELKAELQQQGELFKTGSDTEVLLRAYSKFGADCLKKLNGMFAFAIYDKRARSLFLARDRLGVKPLFYWNRKDGFAFASELRALRGLEGFPKELNQEALGLYFRTGAVPDWASVFAGISKVPPGCWIRYHLDTGVLEGPVSYWDLPAVHEEEGRTEEDWVDEIEGLLWDATRIRLRSDVPLGVFLSGGIDSGLVAAAAAKQVQGLTSLTIGFAGEPEDETALALATARHLGLKPITRNLEMGEGMELLPKTMAHFDEPFSDLSALPTSLVCAEARKDFTVVLSGDAGDEVFAGYRHYLRAWNWRWVNKVPKPGRQVVGSIMARFAAPDSSARRFWLRLSHPVGRMGFGGPLYPFHDWLESCLKPEVILPRERMVELYAKHVPEWDGASSLDLAQRTDLRNYMLEDILVKVDRMSMRHSLEVRSPFLDYRLVELGLRIPSRLRIKNGTNKYLLRKLAARHLPAAVCRAPKQGFEIPVRSWLRNGSGASGWSALWAQKQNGCLNPFREGGAERVWQLGMRNSSLTTALVLLLSFRWWCNAGLGH